MPRGDQVSRFYTLVLDLARSKHGFTAAVLARRRDLPVRTVYRDLRALEAAGFPITSTPTKRWKFIDGWDSRLPFPMPAGQLLALHLARDLMRPLRGTPIAGELDELYDRLSPVQPSEDSTQGELFPRLRRILSTRSQLAIDYAAHSAVLETLCRACETRTTLRAVYYAEIRGELTRRDIDPYCLHYDPQLEAIYVFAWCHLRQEIRTFAVHRFRQAAMTNKTFTAPIGFSVEAYLRRAFRIWRGENAAQVRLLIDREAAGWVSERLWHASQQIHRRPGGACELSFTVDSTRELQRFILQLGAAAEVLQPDWLRQQIAEEQAKAASRNQTKPSKGSLRKMPAQKRQAKAKWRAGQMAK